MSDPGKTAVDVGANIGYMTSVLAARVGAGGSVWSFEAHPEIHRELVENVEVWRAQYPGTTFHAVHRAVSEKHGAVTLRQPAGFDENRGLASVAAPGEGTLEVAADPSTSSWPVPGLA